MPCKAITLSSALAGDGFILFIPVFLQSQNNYVAFFIPSIIFSKWPFLVHIRQTVLVIPVSKYFTNFKVQLKTKFSSQLNGM